FSCCCTSPIIGLVLKLTCASRSNHASTSLLLGYGAESVKPTPLLLLMLRGEYDVTSIRSPCLKCAAENVCIPSHGWFNRRCAPSVMKLGRWPTVADSIDASTPSHGQ